MLIFRNENRATLLLNGAQLCLSGLHAIETRARTRRLSGIGPPPRVSIPDCFARQEGQSKDPTGMIVRLTIGSCNTSARGHSETNLDLKHTSVSRPKAEDA